MRRDEELRRDSPWCWVVCKRCLHRRPVAFVPLIIRWAPDASSGLLRRSACCAKCGAKGAALQQPSWGGEHVNWAVSDPLAKHVRVTQLSLLKSARLAHLKNQYPRNAESTSQAMIRPHGSGLVCTFT